MRKASVEAWDCGECGAGVDREILFAWCDGCSKALCVLCLEASTTCDRCDTIVCRHCTDRFFAVACSGCGFNLHVDCYAFGSANEQCEHCTRTAAAMSA